jgi:diadenosine tetraphosphate (Ap4A) HIT family hydrolase
MTDSAHLNLDNARTPEQKALMEKIIADGVCPFCAENFQKYHPKPVLKETDYWFFTENMSPYAGTKHHFLLVYKPAHINSPAEMLPEAWADLQTVIQWALGEFKMEGGTFAMRFGTAKKYSNSVMHLHAHLIEPNVDDPEHAGVKFPVSKAATQ